MTIVMPTRQSALNTMLPAHAAPVPAAAIDRQLVRSTCPYSAANKLRVLLLTIKGTDKQTDNHTHTHLFNGSFSGSTRVSRYQKRKTNPDFTEARGSGISWAICKSASRTRQKTCQHPTTGLTTTLPIYRPCCAHNVGSIKNVHLLPNNLYHL